MDEACSPRTTGSSPSRRDLRREVALAAQYIHDLAGRSARERRRERRSRARTAGALANGGRLQQPGSKLYTEDFTVPDARAALDALEGARTP